MSTVHQKIAEARQRLAHNVLFGRVCSALLVTAVAWALTVVVVRLFALEWPVWHVGWIAAVGALVVAMIHAVATRPSPLVAAVALDQAAGLKERLSTALVLERDADPFAQAARRDAETQAARVHVPAHIRYAAPHLWPWSTAAVLAAVMLAWLMPTVDLLAGQKEAEAPVSREVLQAEHEAIQVELDKRLERIRELSKDKAELEDVVKDLEPLQMPEDPGATQEDVRRDAVKKIDNVRERLKRQLDAAELESNSELKRMLNKLNQTGSQQEGNAVSKALADGDFDQARQALEKMMQDLQESAKNVEDPEAQKRLADMQQKLQKLAQQLGELGDGVQLQKELEKKGGLSEEEAQELLEKMKNMDPNQLQKELQKQLGESGMSPEQIQQLAKKMMQNQKAQQALKKLAQAMSQASQGCSQCQNPGQSGAGAAQASSAMGEAMSQLSQLEMAEELMNELQAEMAELQGLRDSVCQGDMCPLGNQPGNMSSRLGNQGPQYGRGLGERIGKERTPYQANPEKAKSRFESGAIIGQMLIDGPQIRGEASAEVLDAAEAEIRDAEDAIDRQEIPRQYEKALREYFERLAGLVRERQAAAEPADEPAPAEAESSDTP